MAAKFVVLAVLVACAHGSGLGADYTSFSYGVSDPHTGDIKGQHETRVGSHVVGQYSLLDSDGTKRTVDYAAGPHSGFNAIVRKDPLVHAPIIAAHAAPVSYAAAAPLAYSAHSAISPIAHSAISPIAHSAISPIAHSAISPIAHSAISPLTHSGLAYNTLGYSNYGSAYGYSALPYAGLGLKAGLLGAHGLGW